MKIKLIKPAEKDRSGVLLNNAPRLVDVALPVLAAHTPEPHEVTIVDESFAPDRRDEPVDVVGLSVWTDLAPRAYEIARAYRKRGTKVVMGGIHPTMCPDEAAEHADAIVVGEGEVAWPLLLKDLEEGRLKRRYDQRDSIPDTLTDEILPRRDLYPALRRRSPVPFAVGIEASRGCPYRCEFCSVLEVRGGRYRHRPVDEILREIEAIPQSNLIFVDDNMALQKKLARDLFRGMKGMGKEWVAEANVALAEDPELLHLMRESGCLGLMIGFESVQEDTAREMKKLDRLQIDFDEAVRRFHDAGIAVMANFVFGFDHETTDVFDQTLDFLFRSNIEVAQFRCLVPYPGTPLYDRLKSEGRLLDEEWWCNPNRLPGEAAPLYRPMCMTPEELAEGLLHVTKEFYGVRGTLRRLAGRSPFSRSLKQNAILFGINSVFGNRYRSAYRYALERTREREN